MTESLKSPLWGGHKGSPSSQVKEELQGDCTELRDQTTHEKFTAVSPQQSRALQACSPARSSVRSDMFACTQAHTASLLTHAHTHTPTHRHMCPGPRGNHVLSPSSGYLSLHGHCGGPQSGRAGCADARFRQPSGPPALAAGPPQPERATEGPWELRGMTRL